MARVTREQLLKLQKKYKTDDAIGAIFGITRQAVHQLRNKYNIFSIAEKNKSRNQKMLKLHNKKISGTELAKRFDLSVSQTYRIINELRKKQKKRPSKG